MVKYKKVISARKIQKRIRTLGKQITRDYQGKQPVIICMLKGAVYFFSDLTRNIGVPFTIDFARLSSYKDGMSSGVMEFVSNITANIENKDIIIVEDIVDSGKTLDYFVKSIQEKHPASIRLCAFLDKKERREVEINVDYVGFDIKYGFVVGYGMDFAEKFRGIPYLAEITNPEELI